MPVKLQFTDCCKPSWSLLEYSNNSYFFNITMAQDISSGVKRRPEMQRKD